MPDDDGFPRSVILDILQENVRRSGPAAAASYTLIGAIILLGGIGYAIDDWRGTSPWFLLGGLLLGIVVGFYELAKTVSGTGETGSGDAGRDGRAASPALAGRAALFGARFGGKCWLGMLAPLVVVSGTWVLTERTYQAQSRAADRA